MNNPFYYVSTCPDTGRQFLAESGKDGNICELTPEYVDAIAAVPELLEALRECVTTPGAHAFGGETTAEKTRRMFQRLRAINETARKAIAKTEGRGT